MTGNAIDLEECNHCSSHLQTESSELEPLSPWAGADKLLLDVTLLRAAGSALQQTVLLYLVQTMWRRLFLRLTRASARTFLMGTEENPGWFRLT